MVRRPASSERELWLIDLLSTRGLSARRVAELVYGDAGLRDRVLRRRRALAAAAARVRAMSSQEIDEILARRRAELGGCAHYAPPDPPRPESRKGASLQDDSACRQDCSVGSSSLTPDPWARSCSAAEGTPRRRANACSVQ